MKIQLIFILIAASWCITKVSNLLLLAINYSLSNSAEENNVVQIQYILNIFLKMT